jgi:hypothetical protein
MLSCDNAYQEFLVVSQEASHANLQPRTQPCQGQLWAVVLVGVMATR